jgi:hypothetical protein
MQATVYVIDWPLVVTRGVMLFLDPQMALPFESLHEALAAPELQVCLARSSAEV